MCGIFCSLSTGAHLQPSPEVLDRLKCRGPDSENTDRLRAGSSCNITLCSTVLSLRGSCVTNQPYQGHEGKYVLCWNGEAWRVNCESAIEDDTATIHTLLCQALEEPASTDSSLYGLASAKRIASTLSHVAGPYAFVFLDRDQGHLYFGRDFLGRRSLCWRQTREGNVVLCSITDGIPSHAWQEVEADGVYFIDVKDLPNAFATGHRQSDERGSLSSIAARAPYNLDGEGSSVIPRLSLKSTFPSPQPPLNEDSNSVALLHTMLRESLALRILDVPDPPSTSQDAAQAKIAILFSGGLDCTVLARICHDLLPVQEPIDLLNVAFENPRIHAKLEGGAEAAYELCPDRVTGRASLAELQHVCPDRIFRFVAVNIPYSETLQHRDTVVSLMHPHNTEMDLSLSYALYFAARGQGEMTMSPSNISSWYETPARVLLSGLGADELFGGYTRHATAFRRGGFPGLIDELELDVSRLGKRNLGRDDRVISHWGKEARFPFLDEALLTWALGALVTDKCGFGELSDDSNTATAEIEPGKKVLRCLAWKLGMRKVAKEKKRAIQFGARTAKMETGKTKGTALLS